MPRFWVKWDRKFKGVTKVKKTDKTGDVTGAEVYLHISNGGVTFGVKQGLHGPELSIKASSFGHQTNAMKLFVSKRNLEALAKMFAETAKWDYRPEYCIVTSGRGEDRINDVEWLHESEEFQAAVVKHQQEEYERDVASLNHLVAEITNTTGLDEDGNVRGPLSSFDLSYSNNRITNWMQGTAKNAKSLAELKEIETWWLGKGGILEAGLKALGDCADPKIRKVRGELLNQVLVSFKGYVDKRREQFKSEIKKELA